MSVQFGAHVGAQNATVEELRALWKWLDSAGMDWISLWDHLYEAPPAGGTQPHFEAFSMLGALAVDTSQARLGCLCFCSQYRNIGLLMKGAISVDHLSAGRFELGMGSGWHEQEAEAFGFDFPSQGGRFKVLEGQMQAVNKWRNGERVTHLDNGDGGKGLHQFGWFQFHGSVGFSSRYLLIEYPIWSHMARSARVRASASSLRNMGLSMALRFRPAVSGHGVCGPAVRMVRNLCWSRPPAASRARKPPGRWTEAACGVGPGRK